MRRLSFFITWVALLLVSSCGNSVRYTETTKGDITTITQKRGLTLGYSNTSGIKIITDKGWAFKDLNKNGELDIYEDWRLPFDVRAKDLASKLSIEQIAGLMLYSIHQAVPTDDYGYWGSTYNGTTLAESGLPHSAITDRQKEFLKNDNLRAVLITRVESPRLGAEWNNNLQAFCEGIDFGIPVNISSDPRHEAEVWAEFNAGSGGKISYWPCQLGLAATFDPDLVRKFGEIAAKEYRALGIATALSPQADLGTEPRWLRFYGTFGENADMAADMLKAYVDGFQTSAGKDEIEDGWGYASVNTMIKHWPGGGTGEGGRDAHYSYGKYSVFPGGDFELQLKPFLKGGFNLDGKTKIASAVMPYYTISTNIDPSGNNVGNSYSKYIITDLLREKYKYDGVVCTDWGITHDYNAVKDAEGKPWGRENLSIAERHFEVLKAGVDQFGGNNEKQPILEAYQLWVNEYSEESARARFEQSAVRLLLNMFRTGLFENPYVDPDYTEEIVGCKEFVEAGYKAQLKAVVMLKNTKASIPQQKKTKVYFPKRHIMPSRAFFGATVVGDHWDYSMDTSIVSKFFDITDDPCEADFAFVYIEEPDSPYGYDVNDVENGGNGYMPISLQYEDYVAEDAREVSIGGGDPYEDFTNRSYRGKKVSVYNREDMVLVRATKAKMGDKPVIVGVGMLRPFVPKDIEPYADALLLGINVQHQAMLDIIAGTVEPQGLLPMQMPANMKTVELQNEDSAFDMECYTDSEGHTYDFAFGMNWSGVIKDARTEKYRLSR